MDDQNEQIAHHSYYGGKETPDLRNKLEFAMNRLAEKQIRSLHSILSQPATVRYCCPHQLMGNKRGRHVRTLGASRQSCQRLSYALCHCRFRLPTRASAWLAPE